MKTREELLSALKSTYVPVMAGQKFTVDDFRPEDAPGVAKLYYAVYGDGFAINSVYDPEELARNASGPDLHMVLGRTERGDVVGIYCLFRNPPGKRIMEAGGWIVLPEYRNTSLAMRLAQRLHLNPPQRLDLDVFFGQSVCDHITTQKMSAKFGGSVCALEIDAMPPRPEGGGAPHRISLLDSVLILTDTPHPVYLPRRHVAALGEIYGFCDLTRDFKDDIETAETTRYTLRRMEAASLIRLTANEVGRDFPEVLERLEQEHSDCRIRHLVIGLDAPGASLAAEAARAKGYFFGGLLPLWTDRDAMLLQKVVETPDFASIKLFGDQAQRMFELVKADFDSLPPHG